MYNKVQNIEKKCERLARCERLMFTLNALTCRELQKSVNVVNAFSKLSHNTHATPIYYIIYIYFYLYFNVHNVHRLTQPQ
jgi:hypothetical protein